MPLKLSKERRLIIYDCTNNLWDNRNNNDNILKIKILFKPPLYITWIKKRKEKLVSIYIQK